MQIAPARWLAKLSPGRSPNRRRARPAPPALLGAPGRRCQPARCSCRPSPCSRSRAGRCCTRRPARTGVGRTVLVGRRADADELQRPVMHRGTTSVVNCSRPSAALRLTICSRPGSWIGRPPLLRISILRSSPSGQSPCLPISDRQAPVTKSNPTGGNKQRSREQPSVCSKFGVLKSLHSVANNSVSPWRNA